MSTTNQYDTLYRGGKYNQKTDYKLTIVKDWLDSLNAKEVLDMGCGRGHYIEYLKSYSVTGVEPSRFLCDKYGWTNGTILSHRGIYDALYCMDVLEHISPKGIDENLKALAKLAPRALLGIANHPDVQDGMELHLIQEEAEWWAEKLKLYYSKVRLTYEPLRYFVFECIR